MSGVLWFVEAWKQGAPFVHNTLRSTFLFSFLSQVGKFSGPKDHKSGQALSVLHSPTTIANLSLSHPMVATLQSALQPYHVPSLQQQLGKKITSMKQRNKLDFLISVPGLDAQSHGSPEQGSEALSHTLSFDILMSRSRRRISLEATRAWIIVIQVG